MQRFQMRDIFWLLIVAAIACGWLTDHYRLEPGYRKHQTLAQQLNSIVDALANEGTAVGIGRDGKVHFAHGAVVRVDGCDSVEPLKAAP